MSLLRRLGRTPIDAPIVAILVCLGLALLPVVRWNLAAPKIAGVLLGCSLTLSVARLPSRFRPLLGVGFVLLGLAIATGSVFVVNWPTDKLPGLSRIDSLLLAIPSPLRRSIHPNQIGGVLALVLPITIATAMTGLQRARWLRVAASGATGVLAAAILVSQSRGALLSVLVSLLGFGVWVIWGRRWRARTITTAFALLAVVGVCAVLIDGWRSTDDGLGTFGGRKEIWLRGALMVADAPITGIGIGQFPVLLTAAYPMFATEVDTSLPHAHNWFLQVALDLGIPGLLAVLWLLWRVARPLAQLANRRSGTESVLAAGILAGLIAYLLYGMSDASALGSIGGLVLWLVLGSGAALSRLLQQAQPAQCEPEPRGAPLRKRQVALEKR